MNDLAEKTIVFTPDVLQEYVIVDSFNEECNKVKNEEIKEIVEIVERTPEQLVLYFLDCCGIKCTSINDIGGYIIPRETLLDYEIYDQLKADIPKIKLLLSSTKFTAVQKDADLSQKWPLLNLIRQILRKHNYMLIPKRVCDGYDKDGAKRYKRFFEIMGPISLAPHGETPLAP